VDLDEEIVCALPLDQIGVRKSHVAEVATGVPVRAVALTYQAHQAHPAYLAYLAYQTYPAHPTYLT